MLKLWQQLKSAIIFKYGVAAILLVVPLYPKFPIFNIPGTYVAVRAEDFLLVILGVFWLVQLVRTNLRDFLADKTNQAILLFFGAGLLSILSAIFLTQTVAPHLGFLHWARRIEYLLPFFVAVAAVKLGAKPKFFAETLFLATFMAFLFGLGQIYAGLPVISTQNEEYAKGVALRFVPGARLHSTFAGHYDLAAFLVLVFPVITAYFLHLKNLRHKVLTFFFLILPAFWLFLRTESRISFISFLVGVSLTLWLLRRRLLILPFLLASILGMLLFSDLGARYRRSINTGFQKIQINLNNFARPVLAAESEQKALAQVTFIEDRSTSIRFNVEWPRASRAFAKNPLLGTGYSSVGLATDSDYLRLLAEVGIVGAAAFFLVLTRLIQDMGSFLRLATHLAQDNAFVGGFLGALVGLLVNAAFIDVFEASKVAIIFWTLAGIAVGIVRKEGRYV